MMGVWCVTLSGMSTSAKQATEQAKRMLLGDRLQVVQQLAQAQEEVEKIDARIERERQTRASALDALRDRYDEARRAGWSATELKQLGYAAPRSSSGRRQKKQPGASDAAANHDAATGSPGAASSVVTNGSSPPAGTSVNATVDATVGGDQTDER